MTKKQSSTPVKKSRSTEDLITKSKQSGQITQLEQQLQQTQEQLTNLQTSLGQQDPTLLRKAREELITIHQRLQKLFSEQPEAKPSELLEQLITQRHQAIDQNNELRIANLQSQDYFTKYQAVNKLNQQLKLQLAQLQQDLTITQQDLKSAQRIIELRTKPTADQKLEKSTLDYWTLLKLAGWAGMVYYLWQERDK